MHFALPWLSPARRYDPTVIKPFASNRYLKLLRGEASNAWQVCTPAPPHLLSSLHFRTSLHLRALHALLCLCTSHPYLHPHLHLRTSAPLHPFPCE